MLLVVEPRRDFDIAGTHGRLALPKRVTADS
jgi:hypothetical protein